MCHKMPVALVNNVHFNLCRFNVGCSQFSFSCRPMQIAARLHRGLNARASLDSVHAPTTSDNGSNRFFVTIHVYRRSTQPNNKFVSDTISGNLLHC